MNSEYSYHEGQAKPLAEQTQQDFDDFFERCDGLSYIFLSNEVNSARPTVVSGLLLAEAATSGCDELTDGRIAALSDIAGSKPPDANLAQSIRARVTELMRRGDEFVLVWHIPGDKRVHLYFSPETGPGFLANFLAEEVGLFLIDW